MTTQLTRDDVAALHVIGRPSDGALYTALITRAGTRLLAVGDEKSTLLSSTITRDWNLSPDGDHLAYTEQSGLAMQVRVVSLTEFEPAFPALRAATASGQTLLEADAVLNDTPATVGTASPIWAPDGSLSVGAFQTRAPGDGELRTASSGGDTTATAGFALPLAWSSDGAHLAIRAFEGSGPGRSTAETAAIVGPSGESRTVDGSHILVLGWWNAAR